MKKISKICIKITIGALLMFASFSTVYAINEYTVLAPLPGTTNCGSGVIANDAKCTTDFKTYLPGMFNFAIGLAAVMAFVMITYGGIQYMTTDNLSGKESGRGTITNALYGLLLVIGAYAILYTINPQILKFNLTLSPIDIAASDTVIGDSATATSGSAKQGYVMNEAEKASNKLIKDELFNDSGGKITTNSINPCLNGETTGCTNVNNLPQNAIDGVEQLQKNCNCSILITGGTEGGHLSHGENIPVMDLSSNKPADATLNNYIVTHGSVRQTSLGPLYTVTVNGVNATFLHETSPDHWHVTYK